MPRVVGVFLVGLLIVIGLGLLIPFVLKQRVLSDRVVSQDHLRRLHFATMFASLPGKADFNLAPSEYPSGTLSQPFPVEERISWMILLHNALPMEMPSGQARKPRPVEVDPRILQHLKLNEPWTSESNQLVAATKVKQFLCPPSIPEIPANTPAPTQYIGIGGLGIDTPRKTLFDSAKVAGVFRYDGPTPLNTFADGLSNTVAFSETNFQIGPWMAGGESTVRGIDPTVDQYFGVGRPLGGFHPGGTNIGMADGSVRFITEKIQVGIFRAMCTIAGGEKEFGGD